MKIYFQTYLLLFFVSLAGAQYLEKFLPEPTGNERVGTCDFYFTDSSRNEIFTLKRDDCRNIYVKAWYPASKDAESKYSDYIPDYHTATLKRNYNFLLATRRYFKRLKHYKTNSLVDAAVAEQKQYPVVLFSHGYGIGLSEFYHSILENIASQGYIVLAIVHPYESVIVEFPDGRSTKIRNFPNLIRFNHEFKKFKKAIKYIDSDESYEALLADADQNSEFIKRSQKIWTDDTRFILSMLRAGNEKCDWGVLSGHMDADQVAALGHSFGGSVTGQLCAEEESIKIGINMDGWQFGDVFNKGVKTPFLFIGAEQNGWYDIFYRNNTKAYYSSILKNTQHFSFSDFSVLPNIGEKKRKKYITSDNPLVELQQTNELIVSFLNHFLKGMPLSDEYLPLNKRISGLPAKINKQKISM
ncbi:MAG: hypothetical protein C0594_05505 [Marinilabiliales bacterium]|nr:MAG: hypothetical protein C0594_05505 [Marinilabiliales bacterium]